MSIAEAVGIALGGGSLLVALTAFLWERSQRRQEIALLRRQIAGEFAAKVVALGVGSSFSGDSGPVTIAVSLRNVGRAAARDVQVDLRHPIEGKPAFWHVVAKQNVSAALLPGESQRTDLEHVQRDVVERDDVVLFCSWDDENGFQERELGYLTFLFAR